MSRLRSFALMVTALALLAGCGSPANPAGPAAPGPPADRAAPADPAAGPVAEQLRFSSTTLDGAAFDGQSLAGKPAVLWFWAPWCPKCQAEAPTVAKAAQQHPGVTFVGVAARDQRPAMRDFVTRYQLGGFTHLADLDASVWRRFGVTYQPAYAFVAPDGAVEVVKDTLSEQQLTQRLGALGGA